MNELLLLKLKNQGYCCSQIMVLLVLDLLEKENNDLVAFAGGLCMGGATEKGPCGILTAGMSILSMYAKKEKDRLALMQDEYLLFFKTLVSNGIACREITGDYFPAPDPTACGQLLAKSHPQLMAILVENNFDPCDNSDE